MSDLSNKRIITVATTGAWPKPENNPNLPTTPDEISEEIYNCWKVGAAVAHIHTRNEEFYDDMDINNFRKIYNNLKNDHPDCDIILNFTTGGRTGGDEMVRMAPFIEMRPEMASYDCGTLNWMHYTVFENNTPFLCRLGDKMIECGVKPEIEVFDAAMIYEAKWIAEKGHLKPPYHFQFCLGAAGGLPATIDTVVYLKNILEKELPGSTWSAFGIGKQALEVMYAALAAGGHIRIGMEDNVRYSKEKLAESNMQLVERGVRVIREFGCEPATPDEARQILGLK